MYEAYEPNQLWYIAMNSFIHSVMYSYYALKALGVKVPRNCAMIVTFLQLLQMAFGIIVNVYALNLMWVQGRESECNRGYFGLKVSFGIYVTYFFLFAQFFYSAYFGGKKSRKSHANGHSKSEEKKTLVEESKNGYQNGDSKKDH